MAPLAEPPDFHLRWQGLGAPQRPCAAVVAAMGPLLAERSGTALQLGVTPEIARLSRHGLAIDWNVEMIRMAWPGDSATHRAVLGNWLALPFADDSVDVAFGDGCMTMLGWPEEASLFLQQIWRVLAPGGRLVLRCFVGPDEPEDVEDVAHDALSGAIESFGAFRLRFNTAAFRAAGGDPNSGAHIHRLFERCFPDRGRLASATGWSRTEIDIIDAYAGAGSVHSYPTRSQVAALLPQTARHTFVETAGYPAAERCPLLIVDLP